jgi:hypothetical protein
LTNLAWTSKENIAIDLIFELLEEKRFNRTTQDYLNIDSRLPKIERAFVYVNARLTEIARKGSAPGSTPLRYRRSEADVAQQSNAFPKADPADRKKYRAVRLDIANRSTRLAG